MLLEWEVPVPKTSCLEKIYIPEDIINKARENGIEIKEGAKIPVEITNEDTGGRYSGRLPVTDRGELSIPAKIHELLSKADLIRIAII